MNINNKSKCITYSNTFKNTNNTNNLNIKILVNDKDNTKISNSINKSFTNTNNFNNINLNNSYLIKYIKDKSSDRYKDKYYELNKSKSKSPISKKLKNNKNNTQCKSNVYFKHIFDKNTKFYNNVNGLSNDYLIDTSTNNNSSLIKSSNKVNACYHKDIYKSDKLSNSLNKNKTFLIKDNLKRRRDLMPSNYNVTNIRNIKSNNSFNIVTNNSNISNNTINVNNSFDYYKSKKFIDKINNIIYSNNIKSCKESKTINNKAVFTKNNYHYSKDLQIPLNNVKMNSNNEICYETTHYNIKTLNNKINNNEDILSCKFKYSKKLVSKDAKFKKNNNINNNKQINNKLLNCYNNYNNYKSYVSNDKELCYNKDKDIISNVINSEKEEFPILNTPKPQHYKKNLNITKNKNKASYSEDNNKNIKTSCNKLSSKDLKVLEDIQNMQKFYNLNEDLIDDCISEINNETSLNNLSNQSYLISLQSNKSLFNNIKDCDNKNLENNYNINKCQEIKPYYKAPHKYNSNNQVKYKLEKIKKLKNNYV